jgi:transposase
MLVSEEHEVLQKAELSCEADSENYLGGSSETMYYIGLDVPKRTISYCVKDAAGRVHMEGKIGSTRRELDSWIKTLPQPRTTAMEATIFTGWIYDHLLPHAEKVKVAHPLMLRAIAAAKRKNDKIDAGVGPITALTWALEIGDISRFRSIKQAISYCGLCGAEKSSADKMLRTPISKQRNKHIQHVLVEAAKLAPRQCHELALVYEKEMQRGNRNRATLAVARKIVAYLLAVERRQQDFVPTEEFGGTAAA